MFKLILKDIIVQKKVYITAMLYLVFSIFAFQSVKEMMYSVAIVAFVYLLVSGAFAYDDKSKSDIMLNSLPIKRSQLVMAKYVSILIYTIMGTIAFSIISYSIRILDIPLKTYPITVEGIIGAFFSISLINSIQFPLMFKLGYTKSRFANIMLFLIFFFGATMLINNISINMNNSFFSKALDIIKNQSDAMIGFSIVGLSIVMLFVSYMISVKLYKQREF